MTLIPSVPFPEFIVSGNAYLIEKKDFLFLCGGLTGKVVS